MNGVIRGENIDTSPLEGSSSKDAAALFNWAADRVTDIDFLHFAGLYKEWGNVTDHSLIVNAASVFLAEKLNQAGVAIDRETIDTASLVHDAAKRIDKEAGISYSNEQQSSVLPGLLSWFGYSPEVIAAATHTGRIHEMNIGDDEAQKAAIADLPLEQLVIAYADARVRNAKIVSLKEARDENITKVPADVAVYDLWYSFYRNVEGRIMAVINDPDFTPASLNNEAVTAMVASKA